MGSLKKRNSRGMALLFTLTVGVILSIMAVSLLGLYYGDYHSQRLQQQAIQAYWNARAGIERYSYARLLPEKLTYDLGTSGTCKVIQKDQNLIFEGHSGSMVRQIKLIHGEPGQRVEETSP